MNLRQFDLNLLVALDVLLQERNVTRAADRLYLSQPAMSGILSRLRQAFGDDLLVRVGRSLEPTEFAAGIADQVHKCVHDLEDLLATRPFTPASEISSFRIGATDYAVLLIFEPLMKRLSEIAPGISVNFVKLDSSAGERIAEGIIDFGILPAQFEPQLPSLPLFEDSWVCAGWSRHPANGDELTIDEFLARPHVSFSITDPGHVTVADQYLAQHGHQHKIVATTESFTAAPFLLHGTPLLTMLPRRLGERLRNAAEITLFDPPFELPVLEEKLVWNPRFSASPSHMWMRDQIIEVAQTLS